MAAVEHRSVVFSPGEVAEPAGLLFYSLHGTAPMVLSPRVNVSPGGHVVGVQPAVLRRLVAVVEGLEVRPLVACAGPWSRVLRAYGQARRVPLAGLAVGVAPVVDGGAVGLRVEVPGSSPGGTFSPLAGLVAFEVPALFFVSWRTGTARAGCSLFGFVLGETARPGRSRSSSRSCTRSHRGPGSAGSGSASPPWPAARAARGWWSAPG